MTGLYENEQVRELPAVRAIYDAMHGSHRHAVTGELWYRLLDEACEAASAKVRAYDHGILIQLACGFTCRWLPVVIRCFRCSDGPQTARPRPGWGWPR